MAKLTSAHRNALPNSSFAEPGKRKYPIFDRSHAANAKARVAQHGTPTEKAKVDAAVARKYPSMGKHEHDGSTMKPDHPMLHSDHFHMNRHKG
jgi:hypothetical protein